jgi:co-chaperonin GroES (HSP10)
VSNLSKFQRAAAQAKELVKLVGDCILVEEMAEEEFKTKSGIILQGARNQVAGLEADRPTFARVLQVGEGFYDDETGADVAVGVSPGDIVLVGKHALKRFSVFGKLVSSGDATVALIRESEIQMIFHGQGGFDGYFQLLNDEATPAAQ